MTFDCAKLAATAQRLLARFGKDRIVRRQSAGAYDPETSSATITNVDTVAKGALFDYSAIRYGQRNDDGSLIQIGDKKLLLSPVNFTSDPVVTDLVIADGITWNVINVKALRPADVTVLYELQLRHG